jgi:hypothetical protein
MNAAILMIMTPTLLVWYVMQPEASGLFLLRSVLITVSPLAIGLARKAAVQLLLVQGAAS